MRASIALVHGVRLAAGAGLWLMAAVICAQPAAAQEGVTCGVTYGPDGNMINLGNGRPCGNLPPDRFAAVAISPSNRSMGGSHGQLSQSAAEQSALQTCQRYAKDCAIAYWARNASCVALATTTNAPNAYGAALAPDRSSAAAAALAQCTARGGKDCAVRVTPCGNDDILWSSPLPLPPGNQPNSVDPNLVGTWSHPINPGIWVLQIGPNGVYTFQSQAADGAASTMGTFTAKNGRYIMHSTSTKWDDTGTYEFQAGGTLVLTGQLGSGNWQRVSPGAFR